MERSRQKEKWIIYTFVVLLCLVLVSFWLLCNMYAKYTASASGEDSARVAKFHVTEAGTLKQEINTEVYPGFCGEYEVKVTNNSEVAIDYTIDAKNKYENLPLKMEMLNANKNVLPAEGDSISVGDHTEHTYWLKVSWPKSSENNSQNPDYAGKVDVLEITLKAVQKD